MKKRTLSDLKDQEILLVDSFAQAIMAGRKQTSGEPALTADTIETIRLAGRLDELFNTVRHLATKPPVRAPRLWDPASGQTAADALLSIYGPWLIQEQMHQGLLRKLDKPLCERFLRDQKRKASLPAGELAMQLKVEALLPSQKEFNTRLLAKNMPEDPAERARLQLIRRGRKFRGME